MNKRASERSLWVAVGAGILVIGFLVFVLLTTFAPKKQESVSDSAPQTTSPQENVPVDDLGNSEKTGFDEILLPDGTPSMQGVGSYDELSSIKEIFESNKEYLQLSPVVGEGGAPLLFPSGHTIYKSSVNNMSYIVSGYRLICLDAMSPTDFVFLRDEHTNKRIRVFLTQEKLDEFRANIQTGADILSGATIPEQGTVVLDGEATPLTYRKSGEEYYLDAGVLFEWFADIPLDFEWSPVISLPVSEFVGVEYVTTQIRGMQAVALGYDGVSFDFRSWNGERFNLRLPALRAGSSVMSISTLMQICGWRFFTDGNTLSIVTDEANNTDLGIVYTGNRELSATYKEEDGTWVKYTYDEYDRVVSRVEWTGEGTPYDGAPEEEAGESDTPNDVSGSENAEAIDYTATIG